MTHLERRLRKLEALITDPVGLVPHTQKWLEYWGEQFYLFMSGQDRKAIWDGSIAAYRAVFKHADQNPASLVRRCLQENRAREIGGLVIGRAVS